MFFKRTLSQSQIKDLNIRPATVKLLQENIREKLHDIGFGNDLMDVVHVQLCPTLCNPADCSTPGLSVPCHFMDMTPKIWAKKAKKKKKQKMVLHQTKELQDNTAKETINRIKWQFLEWEKIFADLMSDKGLIFKLYKKSFNSIATTTKKLIKKWQMT